MRSPCRRVFLSTFSQRNRLDDVNLLCWIHNKLQLFLLRFLQWCDFEAVHRLDNFRNETVRVLLSKAPANEAAVGEHKDLTVPPSWEPPGIY